MHWRLSKYLVEEFVKIIRRIFKYNTSWVNKDIEIVRFADGSEQLAFEQFFEENERYPVITVGSQGGNLTRGAFNDFIRAVTDDEIEFGSRMQTALEINGVKTLSVQVPEAMLNNIPNAVILNYAWSGNSIGGGPITAELYSNFTTTPVMVASASLSGTFDRKYTSNFAEFYPTGSLTGSDYWLNFKTTSNDSYYIGMDTDATTLYKYTQYNITTTSTGSVSGKIVLPPFYRIGGNYDSNIIIKCASKNDTSIAYDLSEVISQYIMLLKHTQFDRSSTNSLKYTDILENEVSTLMSKGIHIKDVRIGAVESRKRGENDNIFTIPITVNVFSEWFQDYSVDLLKDINVFLTNYCWLTGNITNSPSINIKVILEGAVSGATMKTVLRPFLPLAQPYNQLPWSYSGSESVTEIPENVVDWVLVELRTETGSATKMTTRAAFLLNTGQIVELDGASPLIFPNIEDGNYYIVIKHRNHLAVMSASPVSITSDGNIYDFTLGLTKYYGSDAINLGGGVYGMYAGDADSSGFIDSDDYMQVDADFGQTGYFKGDTNFTGTVGRSDYDPVSNNMFKSTKVPV